MNLLSQYIIALGNLNGIVAPDTVRDIYNKQNEEQVTLTEVEDYLKNPPEELERNFIFAERGYFIHEVLLEYDEVDDLLAQQQGKAPYMPEKQELLKYVDPFYFGETKQYHALKNFMATRMFSGDEEKAKDFCEDLNADCQYAFELDHVAFLLEQYRVPLDEDIMDELVFYVVAFTEQTRRWEHRGHTPNELPSGPFKQNEDMSDAEELLVDYIGALVNLYGIVSPKKVMEIYNQQNEKKVSLAEVQELLAHPPMALKKMFVYPHRDHFVMETITEPGEFNRIQALKKGKPYYVPEKSVLLMYAQPNYTDQPPVYEKLEAYIKKYLFPGKKNAIKAENVCFELYLVCQYGFNLQGVKQTLDRYDVVFDNQKQMGELIALVMELANNTRLWDNNGYTPLELSVLRGEEVPAMPGAPRTMKKIGRNDPCPCGSGKKYKKCCMLKEA